MTDFMFLLGVLLLPVVGMMWATFPDIEVTWSGVKILTTKSGRDRETLFGLTLYFAVYIIAIAIAYEVLIYFTIGELRLPDPWISVFALAFYGFIAWQFSAIIELT
jgi:hypothetical protein